MPLTDVYIQTPGQFGEFFREIRQGQAPQQFTIQHLKDLGFTSSSHRPFIPLLKALGFLTADGQPTSRYHDYRNEAQARLVMGQALKEAYGDLFVLRSRPTEADRPILEGKFKSTHNASDRVSKLMASTFYALLPLADISVPSNGHPVRTISKPTDDSIEEEEAKHARNHRHSTTSLHYNIQIHLPATKDIEVYNAIFRSLKDNLIE